MKERFQNMLKDVSKIELVYWWILRLLMIYAFIDTAFLSGSSYTASNPPVQIAANLVGMFAYEIIQLFFPKNSRLRLLSHAFQNISALGFFLGSFGGAYMNLYYTLPAYDKILHAYGTAEAVYIGYEYICATQLKLKKTCPHQIANLGALGFGFVLASAWELFEFTYDQFFGCDAQHLNYQAALDAADGNADKIFQLFPMNDISRFALMDTMGDIVLNFIGGFLMFAFLCIFPYRHRGENDINRKIELMNAAEQTAENEPANVG